MKTDFDWSICRGVFKRIRQVVSDHLHETVGISVDRHLFPREHLQVNGSCGFYLTLVFDCLLDNAHQITGCFQQVQRLRLDT